MLKKRFSKWRTGSDVYQLPLVDSNGKKVYRFHCLSWLLEPAERVQSHISCEPYLVASSLCGGIFILSRVKIYGDTAWSPNVYTSHNDLHFRETVCIICYETLTLRHEYTIILYLWNVATNLTTMWSSYYLRALEFIVFLWDT